MGKYHREDGPAYLDVKNLMIYFHHGQLHRLDGPAAIHGNGLVEYYIDDEIPKTILNIVITEQEFDFESFPSAVMLDKYFSKNGERAYRISDPEELIMAILRYG